MKLISYNPKYREKFVEYNIDWIVDNFGAIEKEDVETFENFEKYLENGSMIFMAVEDDNLLAACMIKKDNESEFEICKLCSNKHIPHKGAGTMVFRACMEYAIKNNAKRIYIISNSKLKAALHIYKKFGFKEVKLGDYHYERGDIAFEYLIS